MISVTPIIDTRKQTNYIVRAGSTGSMVANQGNDIWGAVGLRLEKTYVPYVSINQPQGVAMYISCDEATATNQVYISGLDAKGQFIDEIITLEGWTKKQLANLYFRIFEAINLEDSIITTTQQKNVIYIYRNSDTNEGKPTNLATIETIIGSAGLYSLPRSYMTHFTIPFNMRGYVTEFLCGVNFEVPEIRSIFYLMHSPAGRNAVYGQPFFWDQLQSLALNTSGTSVISVEKSERSNIGIPVDPGTDIVMKAFVTGSTHIVTGSITIRLEYL